MKKINLSKYIESKKTVLDAELCLSVARENYAFNVEINSPTLEKQKRNLQEARKAVEAADNDYREKCSELQVLLDNEQSKARTRRLEADEVISAVLEFERHVSVYLSKKLWKGVGFSHDPNGQAFANAYKGIPQSTWYSVERGSNAWFVVSVERKNCASSDKIRPFELNEEQKEAAVQSWYLV